MLSFLFSSVICFVRRSTNMASVRPICPQKHSERLLDRRLTRPSTSTTPTLHRKTSLIKTTPITVTAIKRRKSSKMSAKKQSAASSTLTPIPIRVNSLATIDTDATDLTFQFASTTLTDLPPIRQPSDLPETHSRHTTVVLPQIDHDIDKPNEESSRENPINETLSTASTISSRKSSTDNNIEFAIESFETIRTVGTGTCAIDTICLFVVVFRYIRSSSIGSSSSYEYILCVENDVNQTCHRIETSRTRTKRKEYSHEN